MWSLVLVSKLVTTTYCWSHYNLYLMAGRLATVSEVVGSRTYLTILKRAWPANF
jgi:hypothetical protein